MNGELPTFLWVWDAFAVQKLRLSPFNHIINSDLLHNEYRIQQPSSPLRQKIFYMQRVSFRFDFIHDPAGNQFFKMLQQHLLGDLVNIPLQLGQGRISVFQLINDHRFPFPFDDVMNNLQRAGALLPNHHEIHLHPCSLGLISIHSHTY